LSTDPRSVTAVLFAPCPNITLAARQLAQLVERCKTTSNPDPIYCAIAAYRGSWDRPDTRFADTGRPTVGKGNAPNFDMPKALPGSGPGQTLALGDAVALVGCPDRRIARLCITCCSPSQLWHSRRFVHAVSARGSL